MMTQILPRTFTSPLPEEAELLTGPMAIVTLAGVLDQVVLAPPLLPAMVGGTFGALTLDGLYGVPELRDSRIHLLLELPPGDESYAHLAESGGLLNQPTRLNLSDGTELVAELGHHLGTSTTVSGLGQVTRVSVRLELDHWRYGPEPVAWVAKLDGVKVDQANLITGLGVPHAATQLCYGHLRLRGAYTWHLLSTAGGYSAVIEASAPLRTDLVHADFTALEFTLGRRLSSEVVIGVDEAMRPVSAAAPLMALPRQLGSFPLPPVPPWMARQVWMPRFFEAVARALRGPLATRFYVAINTYLNSISESPDQGYLLLQVALEAFCRYADTPLPPLVANEPAWRAWVEARRSEIERLAANSRSAIRLLDKVRAASQQRPSQDAVRASFAEWGLAVPEVEMSEIDGRHMAAHRYLMNASETERDFERDEDRVAIVRTLLLAAIAREAGYGGPIHGWAGMRFGQPSWWPVTEDVAVAQRWYACLRATPGDKQA